MGVEFYDTFTEASDTNLASHTPDTGTGWTVPYDPNTTVPKVNSTADVCEITTSNNGTGCLALATATLSGDEYDVESDVTTDAPADDRWGLVGRATDEDNLYAAGGSNNAGSFLYKRVSGVETELARNTGTAYDIDSGFTYKLEIRDAAKKWFGKGSEWLSSSDNAITATGSGGYFWGNVVGIAFADVVTTWQLDEFTITTPSGDVSATPSTGAVTVSGETPTSSAGVTASTAKGEVTVTGLAPTVELSVDVTPPAGAVTISGNAPVVAAGASVEAPTGQITVSGLTPTVTTGEVSVGAVPVRRYKLPDNTIVYSKEEVARWFLNQKEEPSTSTPRDEIGTGESVELGAADSAMLRLPELRVIEPGPQSIEKEVSRVDLGALRSMILRMQDEDDIEAILLAI